MLLKRILLAVISMSIGVVATVLIVKFIAGTTVGEYGGLYTFFTSFTIACGVGIWLDLFMGTELLPK